MSRNLSTLSTRDLSLIPLLLLVALLGCRSTSTPAAGGAPEGGPFAPGDLAGDWTGMLQTVQPNKDPFNFYVRFDDAGVPYEAADALGHDWDPSEVVTGMESAIASNGTVSVLIAQLRDGLGPDSLQLQGVMNPTRTYMHGSFVLLEYGQVFTTGTFEAFRSTGPGHFALDLLEGDYSGIGFRDIYGNWRDMSLQIGADGTVHGGSLSIYQFLDGGPNTAVFAWYDDSIGRMENIIIEASDGTLVTFDYALVDETGTYLGGVGRHTTLGEGRAHLKR